VAETERVSVTEASRRGVARLVADAAHGTEVVVEREGEEAREAPRVQRAIPPVKPKQQPMYFSGSAGAEPLTVKRKEAKVGRNDPCPCGSGKKYKKCHGTAA